MLLILDIVLVGLLALVLWLATSRGRARTRRADLRRPRDVADLIPRPPSTDREHRSPPPPPVVVAPPDRRSTWSASAERGETALPAGPTRAEPPDPAPTVGATRMVPPTVVVAPRGTAWVVSRVGASRVSSVHASRDAAEARGRKTARRERVVLEVRDEDAVVIDRTDYTSGRDAEGSARIAT